MLWGWQAASGLGQERRGASPRSPVSLLGRLHAGTNCTTSDAGHLATALPALLPVSRPLKLSVYTKPQRRGRALRGLKDG